MNFETRLKALATLAESKTEAAADALKKEFQTVAGTLSAATLYEQLEQSLSVLRTIGFRFSSEAVQAIGEFVASLERRTITYSEEEQQVWGGRYEYRNATTLTVQAIEVLVGLRYLETRKVIQLLLSLSVHEAESVRKKALEGARELAEYNIKVFHGDAEQGGIGPAPQLDVIDELAKLDDADAEKYWSACLTLLSSLLSPTMEGTAWTYKALTISHAATPAVPSVGQVRTQSIEQLIRFYGLASSVSRKLAAVNALTDATRREMRVPLREDAAAMFSRDGKRVLAFFEEIASGSDLQIIQKIEHNTYWIFHHAISTDVENAALRVRDRIAGNAEYQIYRVLIGFEGIFGDWHQLRESGTEWKETDDLRRNTARELATSIDDRSHPEWRARILRYAETESEDLATFPVFYYFLEQFTVARPDLALKLLVDDGDQIRRFLIPILRSLWSSDRNAQVRALIESWIEAGQNLYAATKLFLSNPSLDVSFVKRLLLRAAEVEDMPTIREVVSVAVSNYAPGRTDLIEELLLPAIEQLSNRSNADWLYENWFRRELKAVITDLPLRAISLILRSLAHISKIDYHAEEILFMIAQRMPGRVLAFLCNRLHHSTGERAHDSERFEAIPYRLHKLNEPLSKHPKLAVRLLRSRYDGNYSAFLYGGGRLLANIFPTFSKEFESELLALVQHGTEHDLEFVLAVLRNYEGQIFLHPICKELVKAIPAGDSLRTEVLIALESSGVVTGEFGLSDMYERKRQEVQSWLDDPDERVREFAKSYVISLERQRDGERKRAEEEIALRKFRYGEK